MPVGEEYHALSDATDLRASDAVRRMLLLHEMVVQ